MWVGWNSSRSTLSETGVSAQAALALVKVSIHAHPKGHADDPAIIDGRSVGRIG